MDTEADPNIMGPAAPMGTSGPWDSQSETMVVRNMAGKTEIIPEMNGKPIDAIHTEAPIAKPAAVPLTNKTPQPTAFFPLVLWGSTSLPRIPKQWKPMLS